LPLTSRLGHTDDALPVKRYLMEYIVLKQRCDALRTELERFHDAAVRATGLLSPARPSGKPNPGGREDAILSVVDAQERLRMVIAHTGEALAARLALIEQLPDERQKTLVTLRYIEGLNWEKIGYAMHYERTQVFAIHSQALLAAQSVLDAM
jgi:DNA-directed RNA polymerase specialized sigma24 family protein